jgi:UDP-N-acetylglucosamine acyltransferase
MASIHPTALVDSQATVADDVAIGPYTIVGPNVTLKAGVVLESHVVVDGHTTVGERTRIYPFASIGLPPQDLKYAGEPTRLVIGVENTIREHVTMNPGTVKGGGLTQVGDNCLFMVAAHIAHDCFIGEGVIMANNATLGGHVTIDDFAIVGGLSAVHQFVRIGRNAMIGGVSGVEQDVIPFGTVMGDRARLSGLNVIGLKRRGFSHEEIQTLRTAYRQLFSDEGTLAERIVEVEREFGTSPPVRIVLDFMKGESERGICKTRTRHAE